MSDQPIQTWAFSGFDCMLWKESDEYFRGCVLRAGEPVACAEVLSRYGEERAKRAVEALAPVMLRPPGIWNIEHEPLTDAVVVPRSLNTPNDVGRLDGVFQLADDLEVIPADRTPTDLIINACDPPGQHEGLRIDLRGSPLYVLARHDAPRKPLYHWDPDGRLQLCIALSRLVRPTSISLRYAARILGRPLSERYKVIPGPVRGFGASAWTTTPEHDWLTAEDFGVLRELLAAWASEPLPPKSRLRQAMWWFDYAASTEFVDIRIPFTSTALERLLTTRSDRSTLHFKHRVPQLAARLRLPPIKPADAGRMWSLRSAIVHGGKHGGLDEQDFALYRQMEDVLREAIRQSIIDKAVRADLLTQESVDAAFPVPEPTPRTVPCPGCGTMVKVPR
jgi:hypothetical protein